MMIMIGIFVENTIKMKYWQAIKRKFLKWHLLGKPERYLWPAALPLPHWSGIRLTMRSSASLSVLGSTERHIGWHCCPHPTPTQSPTNINLIFLIIIPRIFTTASRNERSTKGESKFFLTSDNLVLGIHQFAFDPWKTPSPPPFCF